MKRPLASERPIGPFAIVDKEQLDERVPTMEFTIDKDSIEVQLREPATELDQAKEEVINIIGPRFSNFDIETTRIGDFEVTVPLEGGDPEDVGWLRKQINEAEDDRDLDIYGVELSTT